MARLAVTGLVTASPEEVYQFVTAYAPGGPVSEEALRTKYGRILSREGNTYLFEEDGEEKARWRVRFEPPTRRVMEAIDSRWSDRTDLFQQARGGTRWTVVWQSKVGGVRGVLQLLVFHLFHKRRIRREIIQPVVDSFLVRRPQGP